MENVARCIKDESWVNEEEEGKDWRKSLKVHKQGRGSWKGNQENWVKVVKWRCAAWWNRIELSKLHTRGKRE